MARNFRMIQAGSTNPLVQGKPRKRLFTRHPDRLGKIEAMLAQSVPEPQIRRACSKEFGVTERMVSKYIVEVRQRWREDAQATGCFERENRRDTIRMQLQTAAMKAGATGDIRAQLAALKSLRDLDGLDDSAPEITTSVVNNYSVGLGIGSLGLNSPEDVFKRMDELTGQLAARGPGFMRAHLSVVPPAPEDPEE